MNELLIWSLSKARQQTLNLVSDLNEEQMCQQSVPGENHPAWTLGHLFLGDCFLFILLQTPKAPTMPPGWMELYAPGKAPSGERDRYHRKDILIPMLIESDRFRQQVI